MESLAFWFSPSGRIAPKPFARGILAVYGAAALSLLLMSAPVMLRVGFAPFAFVQALACWAWFCLHAKRLREAVTQGRRLPSPAFTRWRSFCCC